MRVRGVLVVLALVAGTAAPVQASELGQTRDELGRTRDELSDAERELTEAQRTVQRVRDEVAAIDERLRTAATELERVRDELARAEEDLARADARERASAAALARADARLSRALETWEERRDVLEGRAVAAYKHGRGVPGEVLVRGVSRAGDWHEIATTLRTVERLVTTDRQLVDATAEATRTTATARQEVTASRQAALAARRDAASERRRVARLVERREQAVTAVEGELAERERLLGRLEADARARAVLVRELEERVRTLEQAALAPVLASVDVDLDLDATGPTPGWATRLPAAGRPWAGAVDAAATAHGIDGRLLAAVVWTESGFRPGAVSHAGALGLAQLMPGTARLLGVDPRDPLENLAGGATYLRAQLERFGRPELALAAYNAGPGRVRDGRVPDIVETQLYVVRVLERYERLAGG